MRPGDPEYWINTNPESAYHLRLTPPHWLLKKSWELQVSIACSGWKASFRRYAVLPEDAEVFEVMHSGTLERLLELFSEGAASPFSVDRDGRTLLHVSCTNPP